LSVLPARRRAAIGPKSSWADGLGWPEIKWARYNGVAAPSIDLDESTRSPPRQITILPDQIAEIIKVLHKECFKAAVKA
jgi:hypothetical protein